MPVRGAGLACRACWGLSYRSRQNSYKRVGWTAILGTIGESETRHARERRKQAKALRRELRGVARPGRRLTDPP